MLSHAEAATRGSGSTAVRGGIRPPVAPGPLDNAPLAQLHTAAITLSRLLPELHTKWSLLVESFVSRKLLVESFTRNQNSLADTQWPQKTGSSEIPITTNEHGDYKSNVRLYTSYHQEM
jgi:hypothetical protein